MSNSLRIEPWIESEYCCLRDQIEREGDQIGEDAELVLKAPLIWPQEMMASKMPDEMYLTRWWSGDHWERSWQMVGLPIRGLMGDRNGANVTVGSAVRYSPFDSGDHLFDPYTSWLDHTHEGPVTIRLDEDGVQTCLQTGIPHWGLYPWLETRSKCSILEALVGGPIMSMWAIGLLATKYPWPAEKSCQKYVVRGMNESIHKHFWFNDDARVVIGRSTVTAKHNLLGVSTGWSNHRMEEALKYAHIGLLSVDYDERQVRPGLYTTIRDQWLIAKKILDLK